MSKNLEALFGSVQDSDPGIPDSSPSHLPSGKFAGGVDVSTITGSTASLSVSQAEPIVTRVLYLAPKEKDENPFCLGFVGDNRKFCCSTNCAIQKHGINKLEHKAGLFIKVPKRQDHCYTSPFLPDRLLEATLLELFLESEKTVEEWTGIFAHIQASDMKFSKESWAAHQDMRNRAKILKTPKPKVKIKQELMDQLTHLASDLQDLKGTVESSMEDPSDKVELRIATLEFQMKMLGMRLEEWIRAQALDSDDLQVNVEQLISKLIDLEAVVGEYPVTSSAKMEPTIWDSIVSILNKPDPLDPFSSTTWIKSVKDFRNLYTDFMKQKQEHDAFKDALVRLCGQFKSDIEHLDRQIKITNSNIATYSSTNAASNLFGSVQSPPIPEVELLNKNYEDVLGRLEQLNESVKAFASSPTDGSPEGVEIGDLKFPGRPDLGIWVKDNLKDWNYPFGVFLDVYSFLARIQMGYTLEDTAQSMLKSLDLNAKVHLTSDETTTLSGFMYMIPPILGKSGSGNTAISSTKNTFLPALKEKEDWENSMRNGGVKRVIEEQMPNIIYQMKDLIGTRLRGNSQAIMLATTCLSISHTFVVELSRFISDTHRDLDLAGFPANASWLLVTKLVVRMFGTDLDKVRSYMRGKMDTEHPNELATDALWATLRTIGVMQDYMRHGIENHPAISAEYVRFLVLNSGVGTMAKIQEKMKEVESKLEEIGAQAKAAQSAASRANNTAEAAKKLAEKKQ